MIIYGTALSSSTPTDAPTSPRTFLCLKSFMMTLSEINEFSASTLQQSKEDTHTHTHTHTHTRARALLASHLSSEPAGAKRQDTAQANLSEAELVTCRRLYHILQVKVWTPKISSIPSPIM